MTSHSAQQQGGFHPSNQFIRYLQKLAYPQQVGHTFVVQCEIEANISQFAEGWQNESKHFVR